MSNPILKPTGLPADAASQLGGKARSLYELSERMRVRVPPWFAVSSSAFETALDAAGIREPLRAARRRLAAAGPVRAAVLACRAEIAPLLAALHPDDLTRAAIARAYHGLGGGHVAVRSSAIDEDGAERSFAGCMETQLFVDGADSVVEAVRNCWLSGYSERALAYRAARGALETDIAVAVVVQQMIDGGVSGVFFSVDPTSGDRERAILTSTWGLGEGVVSGALECDTFVLQRETGAVIERNLADKISAVVRDAAAGQGTREVELDPSRRHAPSLSAEQIDALSGIGWAIERAYGHPVDVEWTWNEDGPWILQARPITTVAPTGTLPAGARAIHSPAAAALTGVRKRLWDNSNIVESYSGVTTPLTYSFARHAYSIVYRQALELLGVRASDIEDNAQIFEQMIGLLNGRVFYSLESWYRLFMLLPGYQLNAEFMEQMMGVSERAAFAPDRAPMSAARRYAIEIPRLCGLLARIAGRVARFERAVEAFFSNFDAAYAKSSSLDFSALDYDSLVTEYLAAERALLHRWQTPIINDILAMIFYGTMRKLIAAWIGDDGALQNDLLCGEGGLESTAPTRDLLTMMVDVRKDSALCGVLASRSAAEAARAITSDPAFGWLARRIAAHVDRYGDRCIDELKLETPTLRDDPTFVYASLKAYLAAPPITVEEMEARERQIRSQAEERARRALRRRPDRWHLFRWVVGRARLHVKNRENLRFARTRAFGLVRRFVVEMGDRLWRAGKLDEPRDVFYLEMEELVAFARGTASSTDLRGLAGVRKREYAVYRGMPAPPDRLWSTGCVYTDPQLISGAAAAPETADKAEIGTVLRGVAASPGVVRARARLVRDPMDVELQGEVLVAHRTDPGWVPLFPSAVAVVVERGSVLSHSAIVAREFGIPCVVGLRGALDRLTDGAEIEVDGNAGTVTVIGLGERAR